MAQEFKPYIGFDLQRMNMDYNKSYNVSGNSVNVNTILNDSLDGANVHVGGRYGKYFGMELGYFRTQEETKNVATGTAVGPGVIATANFSTKVRVQGITLDGMGYLPLTESGQFELIGTAGVSWNKGEVTGTIPGVGTASDDETEFGLRIGAGAQVNVTDQFNIRGLVRYQTADYSGVADGSWIYSVGLNYNFM